VQDCIRINVGRVNAFGKTRILRLVVTVAALGALAVSAAAQAAPASPSRSRPLKVGIVTAAYGNGDPFTRAAIAGLRGAVRELGVHGEVRTPTPREGYAASLSEFAKLRFDLVVAVGPAVSASLNPVARRSPGVRFASLDIPRGTFPNPPPNLTGIVFKRQEAGYLAGYLAGLVERRKRGRHVVSAVGGVPFPGVDTYIAGYRAGARRADPGIKVLYGYSHSFTAPAACAAVASEQIAKGSGVVFDVAGGCGPGTLRAARSHGVWGVGVDTDQSWRGPQILTSALVNVGVGLFSSIRALKHHQYREGTDLVLGLRQGAVGLGRSSPRVPRSFDARVRRVRRQIVAGRIVVPATLGG
jgi:basic membrane protein A